MSSSKSLLGTRQGRVSLDALWRERSWGHGKREIRDCWVALDPGDSGSQDSLNFGPHLSDCLSPYFQQLNLFAAGQIAPCPITVPVRKSPAGQLWTCQSDKRARWLRRHVQALPWMRAAVWSGGWRLKTENYWRGEKGECTVDPLDKAFLTVHLFSFSFSYSLSSFPVCIPPFLPLLLLHFLFFLPSVPSWLLDIEREIHAAPHVSDKLIQLFRNKSEFTFLATVQQKPSSSGVILSIRELERR